MNYDQFKEHVVTHLKEIYPEDHYEITVRKIAKNNGVILDGLCIFPRGECASPTLYLEPYYEQYKNGSILADVLSRMEEEYRQGRQKTPVINFTSSSYEAVRSRIIFRLVNYEKNQEILKECPYFLFHDLAITFRWLAYRDDVGISTALISNREIKEWKVSRALLFQDACINTPAIFPGHITRMDCVLGKIGVTMEHDCSDLYIMTNDQGINGASCILYESLLKNFAKEKGRSFYLLPSSIHEMMICMEQKEVSTQKLLSLVRDANHMVVTMGEVLSDNIYYYDHKTNHISMISNTSLSS